MLFGVHKALRYVKLPQCKLQYINPSTISNCLSVSCSTQSGPVYLNDTSGVTTEITIVCLRVCKWQQSSTIRSVGKVACGNGNCNFLKPKPCEWPQIDITSLQTSTNCTICETVSQNLIFLFVCAVRLQLLKLPDVKWFAVLVYAACRDRS